MPTTTRQCKAKTRRGVRCQGRALAGSVYCLFHDPNRAQIRALGRSRGGRARHHRSIGTTGVGEVVTIKSMNDVVGLVEKAVNDALQLENSLMRARTLGSLATVAIKALEFATLEDRVANLEAALKGRCRE